MIYWPGRGIWQPPRELVPLSFFGLSPSDWEQGTRPWHRDPAWRPGMSVERSPTLWAPALGLQADRARRMHALGIVFPGAAQMRREVTTGGKSVGPSQAPFSFWRLDEASGNRVDSGTAGHDLSPTNAPGNSAGLIGNALSLSASSAQQLTGTGMTLGAGVSFTFATWGKPSSFNAGERAWGAQINNSFTQGWFLGDSGSGTKHPRIYGCAGAPKTVDDSNFTFSTGTWYFLVIRYDSSAKTLYVRTNDSSQASVSTGASDITNGGNFALGYGQEGVYFDGLLDATAYFNSSLSAADITALWNGGVGTEYYSGAWR